MNMRGKEIIRGLIDLIEGQYGRDIEDAVERGDAPEEELTAIQEARRYIADNSCRVHYAHGLTERWCDREPRHAGPHRGNLEGYTCAHDGRASLSPAKAH